MAKRIAACLFICALMLSCGYKAPPKPPEKLTPERIKSINVIKYPDITIIMVSLPSKYAEGKKIESIRLTVKKCNDRCKKCTTIFNSWVKPDTAFVEDVKVERSTCYRIYGKTKRKKKIPEERIVVNEYHRLPAPRIDVGRITERSVELKVKGCGSFESAIYRRLPTKRYGIMPYRILPPSKERFTDTEVKKGIQYCYTARCVMRHNQEADLSASSNELCLRPMDITPPPVPQNLSGVYHNGRVYLAWDPVKAKDLAGYVIYRFEYGGWVRLNSKPNPLPTFVDENPPPSGPLKYAVSSVDKWGNESKKSKPVILRK
ncbi:MAG: hypothetical protein GXO44_00115 [Deferribacteres bacterium]|nr:hypothetical protein [Deferribacteres bacterium]